MTDKFFVLSETPEEGRAILQLKHDSISLEDWSRFVSACDRLLRTGQKHLILDLRRAHRILSVFIGEALRVNDQARAKGQRFTVLAGGDLVSVFRSLLGPQALEIKTNWDADHDAGETEKGEPQ